MVTMKQRLDDIIANPHLLKFYAKSNCRTCYGRGFYEINTRHPKSTIWMHHKTLCSCVKKALQREQKELRDG